MEGFMPGVAPTSGISEQCADLIRERCGVIIHELHTVMKDEQVQITGQIGSWHGKQLASEAARQLFPGLRIDNKLIVIKTR